MGLVYFAVDTEKTRGRDNYMMTGAAAMQNWLSSNRSHFLTLKRSNQDLYLGYADSIRYDSNVPESDVPLKKVSYLQDKKPAVSHGKAWKERNKNGSILVTPWWGYGFRITRNGVAETEKIPGGRERFMFQYDFGMGGLPRKNGEFPYYYISATYSEQYVSNVAHISETDISDEDISGSFQLGPQAHDATITAALAEANQGYYDLLTELAELPETLSYLYGLLSQAKEATVAAKNKEVRYKQMFKRKLLTAVQLADALASVWMQYRYAISPIVYSLQDIEKTLGVYSRLFKTARGKDELDAASLPTNLKGLTYVGHSGSITDRVFIKRSYSAEALVDGILRNISLNPFATAWELVPLSFVVDWFVNIGDVISAVTGPQVHTQQSSTLSRKYDLIVTYEDVDSGASVDIEIKSYSRVLFNPLDHVGLSLDPFINWKRALDALALSWAASRGEWMKLLKLR